MANRKLTELPTLEPINFDSTDLIYIVDVQAKGGAGESKSIPFSRLAGNSLSTLSAYDDQNTLNMLYLSAAIVVNENDITALDSDGVAQASNINYLSGQIDLNNTLVDTISTDLDNFDLALIASDVVDLSGDVVSLSAENLEFVEARGIFTSDISTLCANIDFLSGSIEDNEDNIGTLASLNTTDKNNLVAAINEVDGETNDNTLDIANTRTLSGFSGTVTPGGATQSHTVDIIIGGTTYKMLLAT
jgi:hypothetical protein